MLYVSNRILLLGNTVRRCTVIYDLAIYITIYMCVYIYATVCS